LFFNLIACGTRSAWVSFVVIAILGIIYLIKNKAKEQFKRLMLLSVSFIIIFVYLINGGSDFVNKKINSIKNDTQVLVSDGVKDDLGSYRIIIWKFTFKLIKEVPILGCGTDNLKLGMFKYLEDDYLSFALKMKASVDKAHNEYLHIAATIGIPALIIYLSFIFLVLKPRIKKMFIDQISLLFSLVIISYLCQAFFNISTIGVAPLFWMILGLSDKYLLD